jgi:hypothetical protein
MKMHRTVLSSALALWLIGIGFMGCSMAQSRESAPSPSVPASELLLGVEAFPLGWTFRACQDNCGRIEGEMHAERSFFLPDVPGLVLLELSRSPDLDVVERQYQSYYETEFRERAPPNRQFTPPTSESFRSDFADEYYFGCGVDEVPGCRAIFRYGNYFVHFYSSWDNGNGEGLTQPEILQVLQALDAHVTEQLR